MPLLIDLHAVSAPVERRGTGGLDDALLDSLAGELALIVTSVDERATCDLPASCTRRELGLRVDPGCAGVPWPYRLPRLYKFAPIGRIEADLVRLRAELEIAVRRTRRLTTADGAAALPA